MDMRSKPPSIVLWVTYALGCIIFSSHCWAGDIFGADQKVTPLASANLLSPLANCSFSAVGQPLSLQEAVERALCNNPKTRTAWAQTKLQAAEIGIAKAAYLPNFTGNVEETRDHSQTHVSGHAELSSSNAEYQQSKALSLSWVLYDFGGRSAAIDSAIALFSAAKANHDAVLQTVFATVAKDYYAAQAAEGSLQAAREVELRAKDAFDAASTRVANGVAPISDQLQAQTAYAQAIVSRTKAYGDSQIAVGTLASDMDLQPNQSLALPAVDGRFASHAEIDEAIDELIKEATAEHPSVVAAKSQLDAARAKEREVRAQGLPSISLVGRDARNNQSISPAVGSQALPAYGRDTYLGIQITLPIFEGFARTYQVRQAAAQIEVQRATFDETLRKVSLDVWTSYHTLHTSIDNLDNSATLLSVAESSYDATERRYLAGVGGILELLSAQTSLAGAKRQRIIALTDWRSARLQLAGALGRLGSWNIPTGWSQ